MVFILIGRIRCIECDLVAGEPNFVSWLCVNDIRVFCECSCIKDFAFDLKNFVIQIKSV